MCGVEFQDRSSNDYIRPLNDVKNEERQSSGAKSNRNYIANDDSSFLVAIKSKTPEDDEQELMNDAISEKAEELGVPADFLVEKMPAIQEKYKELVSGCCGSLLCGFMTGGNSNYLEACIEKAIKSLNPEDILYSELEKSKTWFPFSNTNQRINEIKEMLNNEYIFNLGDAYNPGDPKEKYTLHELMSVLNTAQCETLVSLILELKEYCDSEGVESFLHAAETNVNMHIVDFRAADKIRGEYFIKRLELMTSFVKTVAEKECGEGITIKEKYWIRSTGSDPHENGQHALFLVEKDSKNIKKVFKPHDLTPDAAVVSKKGILSKINEEISGKDWLKGTPIAGEPAFLTMEINTEKQSEEFLTKKEEMTEEEAVKYFFRAGMLEAVAETMHIIDLHEDNIMPIQKGNIVAPMIIDAEINFFMNKETGLDNAMRNTDDKRNSFFKIGNTESSGSVFENKDSKYNHKYTEGYNFMLTKMSENIVFFKDIYKNALTGVGDIRIIPFGTDTFKNVLESVIERQHDVAAIDLYLKSVCDELRNHLRKSCFIFSWDDDGLQLNIGKENLKIALWKNLESGTIPAFHVSMETGEIFVGNDVVAKITYNGPPEYKIIRKGNMIEIVKTHRLIKEHIIEAMLRGFGEEVYESCEKLKPRTQNQQQPQSLDNTPDIDAIIKILDE